MAKNIQIYIKTLKSGKTKFNVANTKGTDGYWYNVKCTKATGIDLNTYHQGYYNLSFDESLANTREEPYVSKTGKQGIDRTLWIKDANAKIEPSVFDLDLPF